MDTHTQPAAGTGAHNEFPGLNVLILFEDFDTGVRARRPIDRLAGTTRPNPEGAITLIKFDLLQDSTLRRLAVRMARDAELIIVSAHSTKTIPEEFHRWMDEWWAQKGDARCGLVVILDEGGGARSSDSPMMSQFRRLADDEHVDFFCRCLEPPEVDETSPERITERATAVTSVLEGILHQEEFIPRCTVY